MDPIERIAETVNVDKHAQAAGARGGSLSLFSCPECGGSLWQLDEDRLVSFRCHVGHVYLAEALLAEQAEALEAALWTAVRTFREREVLSRQLAARARAAGEIDRADRFDEEARSADRNASLIQQHLLQGGTPPDPASLKRGPGS